MTEQDKELGKHKLPIESKSASQPSEEHPFESRKKRRKIFSFLSMSIVVCGVFIYVFLTLFPKDDEAIIIEGSRRRAIQLDVLNATDERGLAQRATDFLREKGFDVVEMGNYLIKDQDQTIVYDRTGKMDGALSVAEALGVPQEQVIQKIDPTLYIDVTVIIGRDYRTLKPWR